MTSFDEKFSDSFDFMKNNKGTDVKDANIKSILNDLISDYKSDDGRKKRTFGSTENEKNENTSNIIKEQLSGLSQLMKDECDSLIANQEIMKAYMVESQKIAIDAVAGVLDKSSITDLSSNELSEQAYAVIKSELNLLNQSDTMKEEFQDYHNHDPVILKESSQYASDISRDKIRSENIDPEKSSLINSILRYSSDFSVDKFSQSPNSPFFEAGLVLEDVNENKKSNEHHISLENNLDSPSMSR